MIDVIALGILGLGAWRGWKRGTLLMALSLSGIVAGYVGAVLLARPIGAILAGSSAVPPLLAAPLGGAAGFILFSVVNRLLTRRVERRRSAAIRGGAEFPPVDHAGGAALGAVGAAALLVLVVWGAVSLQRVVPGMPAVDRTVAGRSAVALAQRAATIVARRAVGDHFSANVMARIVANPARTVPVLTAALNSEGVRGLVSDQALRTAIVNGNTAAVAASPALRMLSADPDFRAAAAEFGLSDSAADPARLAQDLTSRLGPLVRAFETARESPEYARLASDQRLHERLRAGDLPALIGNPSFDALLARFRSELRSGGP
jgi:uncharacterized membrane protein required for colicin V production